MPSFRWDVSKNAFTKTCSCCGFEAVGVIDKEASIEIFLKTFSQSNGSADSADNMQSRCYICNSHRRRQLGMSLEILRNMLEQQEGCCAICSVPISLDRGAPNPVNVDHDANTGKVRQLLCGNCNRGIGLFFHNPDLLQAAVEYCRLHEDDNG